MDHHDNSYAHEFMADAQKVDRCEPRATRTKATPQHRHRSLRKAPAQCRYCTTRVNFAACVRVVAPEVKFPVTVTVYVPACGLVPPLPLPEPPPQEVSINPSVTSAANPTTRIQARLCSRRKNCDATTISRNIAATVKIIGVCRYRASLGQPPRNGRSHPCAAVVTVTIAVCAAAPLSAIVLGDTAHADPAGPPLQLNATLAAELPAGATAINKLAVCPALTVALAEPGVMEKSKPLPVSATVCGLFPALSVIFSVPVLVPPAGRIEENADGTVQTWRDRIGSSC